MPGVSNVRDISSDTFGPAVLQRSHEIPVVVDFWAAWCGPCRVLGPVLEQLADEYDGEFDLVKVDVDANQQLAAQFGVQSIPTVVGFHQGQAAARFTGALSEQAVREWIGQLLPSPADRTVEAARDATLDGDSAHAETLYREVLAGDASHHDAGTGLAALLIARGDTEEALIVLGRLSATDEVQRLAAAARVAANRSGDVGDLEAKLAADPEDAATRLELARTLATHAEYEPALDHLLAVVAGKGALVDEARRAMLDIFTVLGDGHPLTATYRRQLANLLF